MESAAEIAAEQREIVTGLIAVLSRRGQTLATAESLTGGLLASIITDVPGASKIFRGGLVTYATDLKAQLAGVDDQLLAKHGAVSAETALQMAAGAATRCGADWAIATTGVAGPEPQEGHPVGTVFVAVVGQGQAEARALSLAGSRSEIRQQTAAIALYLLAEAVEQRE